MSQQNVEQVIGRLVTDEGFRRRFAANRAAAVQELLAAGYRLTAVEQRALLELDAAACERFAEVLDPRLQKISLGSGS